MPCPLFLSTPLQALGAGGSGQPCTAGHRFFLGARQKKIFCCPGAGGDANSGMKPPSSSMCVRATVLAAGQWRRGRASAGRPVAMGGTHHLPCTPGEAFPARLQLGRLRRGLGGGHRLFFSSNARLTKAKEEKQPVGEQSFGNSSSPQRKQHGPKHRSLKATAVPPPQKPRQWGQESERPPSPLAQGTAAPGGKRRRSRGLPWEASRASTASSSSGGVTSSISAPRSTAAPARVAPAGNFIAPERGEVRAPPGGWLGQGAAPVPSHPRGSRGGELEAHLACNLFFYYNYFQRGCKDLAGR